MPSEEDLRGASGLIQTLAIVGGLIALFVGAVTPEMFGATMLAFIALNVRY